MRSSTRGLALLGALLLGGGMVAWIVRDPGGPRLQAPPARKHADPQAAAADARASAESAPARPNASIASTREVMAAADSAELDPRLLPAAVAALPLADGGHDGVELVVLAPDRSPVAHATVLWCRAAEGAAPTFATLRDSTQLTAAGAVRLATDPAGRCRLPRTLDPATAFAFAAGGRGAVRLAPATFFPVELLIEPPFVVEVQVADAGGAAQAGVEVGFGPKDGDPFQPAVSATTGADGIARFADLDLELLGMRLPRRSEEATASRRAGGEWLVAIRGVVGSGVRQRVTLPPDPPATAAAPLRVALTLPPAGGVTFTVRGADDRPLADGAISFQARGPAGAEVSGALLCEDDGTVRVAPVELGWTARIEASAPGHARVRRDIDGPRRAGEVVAIELLLTPTQLRIRGRAIAADGRPLPGLPLSVAGSAVGVDSGADGSFEFDGAGLAQGDRRERDRRRKRNAATTPPADNRRALFVLTAADPHAPSHEALVEFTLPERGVLDLGAIRFEARPLLAAGRVVDETGAPLADTHVAAAVDRPSAWIAEQGENARTTVSMRTGADGRFTLHANAAAAVFHLFAHRSGLLRPPPLEIAPGTRDLELVLRRGGSCEASLRADGALAPRWFVARLEESGGRSLNARRRVGWAICAGSCCRQGRTTSCWRSPTGTRASSCCAFRASRSPRRRSLVIRDSRASIPRPSCRRRRWCRSPSMDRSSRRGASCSGTRRSRVARSSRSDRAG